MTNKDNKCKSLTRAQQFCLDVEKLALQYELPFFLVTDGASITRNKNCPAVEHARKEHIEWEKMHSIDSKEDWLCDKKI